MLAMQPALGESMKGNWVFVGGKLAADKASPDSVAHADVVFRTEKTTSSDAAIFGDLLWKGELVSRTISHVGPLKAGEEATTSIGLQIPFCVPAGEYEVRVGIEKEMLADGADSALVGKIQVGSPVQAAPLAGVAEDFHLPETFSAGELVPASVRVRLTEKTSFDTHPYISMWKDGLLMGVAEIQEALPTSQWPVDEQKEVSISFVPPSGIPPGTYEFAFGLHRIDLRNIPAQVTATITGNTPPHHWKPLSHGVYHDQKSGESHLWYVNQNKALIWDGKPFIPMGGMILSSLLKGYKPGDAAFNKTLWAKDLAAYKLIREKGVQDVYINPVVSGSNIPTWLWQFYLDQLEEFGFVYGVQVNRHLGEADARGISAYFPRARKEIEQFKVNNINSDRTVSITIPTTIIRRSPEPVGGLFVVVNNETGKPVQAGTATAVPAGEGKMKLSARVRLPDSSFHTVYFTPLMRFGGAHMLNFWDNEEALAKSFHAFAQRLEPGPGLRFFVDPGVNESHWEEGPRITSPVWNAKFAAWLSEKYGSIDALNHVWQTTPAVPDFETAAAIIPVCSVNADETPSNRLVFVDPRHDSIYELPAKGIAWDDYLDYVLVAFNRYNNQMADWLKAEIDVPVIFKHVSHTSEGFVNRGTKGGFDGIGSEDYGSYQRIRYLTGYHFSAADHFARTAWLVVTETNTEENIDKKFASKQFSYPDKAYMHEHFDVLLDAGNKGIYDFLLGGGDSFDSEQPLDITYTYIRNPHVFPWLNEYRDKLLAGEGPRRITETGPTRPYFYYLTEYEGNVWWKDPNTRSSVLANNDVKNPRMTETDDGFIVVPCFDVGASAKVVLVNASDAPASQTLGPQINALFAHQPSGQRIVYFGLRKDLGSISELDKYFTDQTVVNEAGEVVQILRPTSTSQVLRTTGDGQPWALRDGELWIVANDSFLASEGHQSVVRYVKELGISDLTSLKQGAISTR